MALPLSTRIKAAGQLLFSGTVKRDYIPALSPFDGWDVGGELEVYSARKAFCKECGGLDV